MTLALGLFAHDLATICVIGFVLSCSQMFAEVVIDSVFVELGNSLPLSRTSPSYASVPGSETENSPPATPGHVRDPAGDSGSASTEPAPAPSDTPVLQTRLLSDHLSCSNKGREQVQEAEEVEIDLEMNV